MKIQHYNLEPNGWGWIDYYLCDCCCLVAKSCLTLLQPHGLAHQASLSRRFPRQDYWNRLPFPFPRDFPNPGIFPTFVSCIAGGFFTTEPLGKFYLYQYNSDTTLKMKALFNIGVESGDVLGAPGEEWSQIISDLSVWRLSRTSCFHSQPQTFLYIIVQNSIKYLLPAVIMLQIRALIFPGCLLKANKGEVGWEIFSHQWN